MLLLDGQVHHDTHVIPMGNYVIMVGNYVIATPSELGNYMSADIAGALQRPHLPGHATRWLNWRRRHQARSRWFHQRTRLNRDNALVS